MNTIGERSQKTKGIAVALGGGGARGLAHICVIEALDELGVTPAAISGTSMGAVIGAAWAAGLSGSEIREHVQKLVRHRPSAIARVLQARAAGIRGLFGGGPGNAGLLDGEKLLDLFWPRNVPDTFDALQTPFSCVATDFFARRECIFREGALTPAVAASLAIPGLVKPITREGAVYVDGGAVNPLPFTHLLNQGHFVIACDVTGGPVESGRSAPQPFEALFGTAQIMQASITAQMLMASRPDLLIKPDVDNYRVLDFFRASAILAAAAPVKDEIKRSVERVLEQS